MISPGINERENHRSAIAEPGTFPANTALAILAFQGFHVGKDYTKGSVLSVVDNPDFDVQKTTTSLYWKP